MCLFAQGGGLLAVELHQLAADADRFDVGGLLLLLHRQRLDAGRLQFGERAAFEADLFIAFAQCLVGFAQGVALADDAGVGLVVRFALLRGGLLGVGIRLVAFFHHVDLVVQIARGVVLPFGFQILGGLGRLLAFLLDVGKALVERGQRGIEVGRALRHALDGLGVFLKQLAALGELALRVGLHGGAAKEVAERVVHHRGLRLAVAGAGFFEAADLLDQRDLLAVEPVDFGDVALALGIIHVAGQLFRARLQGIEVVGERLGEELAQPDLLQPVECLHEVEDAFLRQARDR